MYEVTVPAINTRLTLRSRTLKGARDLYSACLKAGFRRDVITVRIRKQEVEFPDTATYIVGVPRG